MKWRYAPPGNFNAFSLFSSLGRKSCTVAKMARGEIPWRWPNVAPETTSFVKFVHSGTSLEGNKSRSKLGIPMTRKALAFHASSRFASPPPPPTQKDLGTTGWCNNNNTHVRNSNGTVSNFQCERKKTSAGWKRAPRKIKAEGKTRERIAFECQ